MSKQKPENIKKHICVGMLAHVDAGKTTLSEGILFQSGTTRSLGRVAVSYTHLRTEADSCAD